LPTFSSNKTRDFSNYERKNYRTGFITAPSIMIELATGLCLIYHKPNLYHSPNVGLMRVIALSTAFIQVPIHLKLLKNTSVQLTDKLILTHWIRTIS
ncbi:MAG: hypothetical protein ACJASM_000559, partial [Salibacteraceae bacterium]